jgi:N-acetylglucosaminyldiphosphoundecaprenol N-acetyl-beta-D-mannosaminyltransferase
MPEVVADLAGNLRTHFPALKIAGYEPSIFRSLSEQEQLELAARVKASGANAFILGLGCPRQEVWAYEYRDLLGIPILAVGAAFDFFAGNLPQAPKYLQDKGLEWLFRLTKEPKRLWRRYFFLNPLYLWYIFQQWLGLRKFMPAMPKGNEKVEPYG